MITATNRLQLEFQILDGNIHDRNSFDCGDVNLNNYLKTQAALSAKRLIARTRVLVDPSKPKEIFGFYTYSSAELTVPSNFPENSTPSKKILKTYKHNIPGVKLVRMAVAKQHQGKRLGEQLLIDMVLMAAQVNLNGMSPPVVGLFVDAKIGATAFYTKYGFVSVDGLSTQYLWLPDSHCQQVYKSVNSP